jgi:hypothetical protein
MPCRPHSVDAEHPKGDTAAPNHFFQGNRLGAKSTVLDFAIAVACLVV